MTLTRDAIASGAIEELLVEAERKGVFKRMPPEERERSRREILAQLPKGEDIWLFGYGSLMWNPAIHIVGQMPGRIHGYHRSFCLWTAMGRGSPEHPGLMLALEPGGSCQGIALRVAAEAAEQELEIVWNREMVSGAYVPRLVRIHADDGPFTAITFVINRAHERYAGPLPISTMVEAIAHAEGHLGRNSDYLFNTVAHLDELDVGDGPLHDLARRVRKCLAEQS